MRRTLSVPLIGASMLLVTLGSTQGEVSPPPTKTVSYVTAPTPSGHHEAGCPGRDAGLFISSRGKTVTFEYAYSMFLEHAKMRVSSNVAYILCKRGRDKVKAKWTESCYTWLNDMSRSSRVFYRGIDVNHYIWSPENGHSVNPRKYHVKNDHSHQNCHRSDIAYDKEHWLFLHKRDFPKNPNAFWRAHVGINLAFSFPDPDFNMPRRGHGYAFHPSMDFLVRR